MNKLIPDKRFGYNLRVLRKRNHFTQDQLVGRLGILGVSTTRSLYSRMETGELNVPVSLLVALHKIYACCYDEFFKDLSPESEDK